MNKCKECQTETENKTYCSYDCKSKTWKKPVSILCGYCKKEKQIQFSRATQYQHHYCNKECMALDYKQRFNGELNNNFGNKWDNEQKEYLSKIRTQQEGIPINEIYNLYNQGQTDVSISKHLNISTETVKKYRLKKGYKANGNFLPLTDKDKQNLEKYGIAMNWERKNCIVPHFSKETEKHIKAKCAASIILLERGYDFFTEVPTHKGIIDVYDFTNKTIYEMETDCSDNKRKEKINQLFDKDKMTDIFVIDLRDLPNDMDGMCKYFEKMII